MPFEKEPALVSALFSRIARRYDLMNRLMTFGRDQAWRALAARMLAPRPGQRILDLGAGTGDLGCAIRKAQPGVLLVSADFNPLMLAGARAKGLAGLVVADAHRLPFPTAAFAGLASGFLVRNVSDLETALGEMKRVLQPGGRLVVLDTTRPRRNLLLPFIRFHLRVVIPWLGRLVTGDLDAYRYLPGTTEAFLSAEELAEKITQAGFTGVTFRRLMFGAAALHWGVTNPDEGVGIRA